MSKRSRGQAMLAAASSKKSGAASSVGSGRKADPLARPTSRSEAVDFELGASLKSSLSSSAQSSASAGRISRSSGGGGIDSASKARAKENSGESDLNTGSTEEIVRSASEKMRGQGRQRGQSSTLSTSTSASQKGSANRESALLSSSSSSSSSSSGGGGGGGRKRPVAPLPSMLERQCMKLLNDFKMLEVALTNLARKKQATWEQTCQYVGTLSSSSFDMEDLELILTVWPEALLLNWRMVAADNLSEPEYCLCLSLAALPKEKGDGDGVDKGNRNAIFANKLMRAREKAEKESSSGNSNNANDDGESVPVLLQAKADVIPQKKQRVSTGSGKGDRGRTGARGVTAGARARALVSQIGFMVPNGSLDGSSPSNSSAVTGSSSQGSATDLGASLSMFGSQEVKLTNTIVSMDRLREMARERERAARQNAVNVANERKRLLARARITGLVPLCDTLRTLCKASKVKNQYSILAADVIREISSSAATVTVGGGSRGGAWEGLHLGEGSGSGGGSDEMMTRFRLIAREAPEFMAISPPDEVVPAYTLTLYVQIDYAHVRAKIGAFAARALSQLDSKVF